MGRKGFVDLGRGLTAPAFAPHLLVGNEELRQPCSVICHTKGLELDAEAIAEFPRWTMVERWDRLVGADVTSTAGGVSLTLVSRSPNHIRLVFPGRTVDELREAIEPFRSQIGRALRANGVSPTEPADPLPDVMFETHDGGIEVWFSEVVAHEHGDMVDEFVAWLQSFKGVRDVWREDTEFLVVLGSFSHRELRHQVRAWWRDRLPDLVTK